MALDHVVIHDARLHGCVYPHANMHVIRTQASTTLQAIIDEVRRLAGGGSRPFARLSLFGHGASITNPTDERDRTLQIGQLIDSRNARAFGAGIAGCVSDRVRVLGCGAAGSPNGRQLCQNLADGARVPVYASSETQSLNVRTRVRTFAGYELGPMSDPTINFGAWEGEVIRFSPGAPARTVFTGPAPQPPSGGSSRPPVCSPSARATQL